MDSIIKENLKKLQEGKKEDKYVYDLDLNYQHGLKQLLEDLRIQGEIKSDDDRNYLFGSVLISANEKNFVDIYCTILNDTRVPFKSKALADFVLRVFSIDDINGDVIEIDDDLTSQEKIEIYKKHELEESDKQIINILEQTYLFDKYHLKEHLLLSNYELAHDGDCIKMMYELNKENPDKEFLKRQSYNAPFTLLTITTGLNINYDINKLTDISDDERQMFKQYTTLNINNNYNNITKNMIKYFAQGLTEMELNFDPNVNSYTKIYIIKETFENNPKLTNIKINDRKYPRYNFVNLENISNEKNTINKDDIEI